MTDKRYETGSGNVFKDLGLPHAEEHLIKAQLVYKIDAILKDRKLKKVQASIQGDEVRISSPSRDELQGVIQLLREEDFGVALQFGNYRE